MLSARGFVMSQAAKLILSGPLLFLGSGPLLPGDSCGDWMGSGRAPVSVDRDRVPGRGVRAVSFGFVGLVLS